MKKLLIVTTLGFLVSCGAGKQPIEPTSNSPTPGTLEEEKVATAYSIDNIRAAFYKQICPDGLKNCESNKSHLATDYSSFDLKNFGIAPKVQVLIV